MIDDLEHARIVRERISGKTTREIARDRRVTVPEINRILDLAAAGAFSAEGLKRTMLLEAEQLIHLKNQLWERAMDGDNTASALYIKAAERLATMIGLNAPHGHVVMITSTMAPADTATSTQKMLAAIRLLRNEEPEASTSED